MDPVERGKCSLADMGPTLPYGTATTVQLPNYCGKARFLVPVVVSIGGCHDFRNRGGYVQHHIPNGRIMGDKCLHLAKALSRIKERRAANDKARESLGWIVLKRGCEPRG